MSSRFPGAPAVAMIVQGSLRLDQAQIGPDVSRGLDIRDAAGTSGVATLFVSGTIFYTRKVAVEASMGSDVRLHNCTIVGIREGSAAVNITAGGRIDVTALNLDVSNGPGLFLRCVQAHTPRCRQPVHSA